MLSILVNVRKIITFRPILQIWILLKLQAILELSSNFTFEPKFGIDLILWLFTGTEC